MFKKIRLIKIIFSIIFYLFFSLSASIAQNDGHKIVLLVNEDIISSYDIIQRMKITSLLNNITINDQNSLAISNQIIDELVDQVIKNEKINEYKINITDIELQEYVTGYYNQYGKSNEDAINLLLDNDLNPEIIREYIRTEVAWNKLISGLYFRLISVSEIEIEELINLDPSIDKKLAANIIKDRQIEIKANKYLRDLRDSSTIEYR